MYMLLLMVVGILLLFTTLITKPKKRTRKKLFTFAILLVVVGGSGALKDYQSKSNGTSLSTSKTNVSSSSKLADLDYQNEQEIQVNHDQPTFTPEDLDVSKGAWQSFSDLDNLNRAIQADALLNRSLMPTAKREPLYVNPTGWHNKRINGGWLYNRSHLIGYQLSGQNNNPKNLMTGTRSLNTPEMLKHEDDIAYYLKQNPNNFIRYRVQPIYRGNELLARGVSMMAESLDANGNPDKQINFNVYIFNVEKGVNINYADGTSVVNNTKE